MRREDVELVDSVLGTVQWFKADKGFGFLTPEGGGEDVFVHVSAVVDEGVQSLVQGQRVEFDRIEGERGVQAGNVRLLGGVAPAEPDDAPRPGAVTGQVLWYDPDKGFGFLSRDDGEPDVFVHSSVLGARHWLDEGERVEFLVTAGPRGPQAEGVRLLPDNPAEGGRLVVGGTVHWFDEAKGFGFITPDDIFVHATAISGGAGARVLHEGQRVEFVLTPGEKGLQAERVRVTSDAAPARPARRDDRRDERRDDRRDTRGDDRRDTRWSERREDRRDDRRDDRGPRRDDRRARTAGGNGTVAWFKADKGFGFITPDDGGEDVFVHFREIADTGGFRTLSEGQRVQFRVEQTDRGPHAKDVCPE